MQSQSRTLLKSCEWPAAGNEQGCTRPLVPLRWAALAWPQVASRQGQWGSQEAGGRPWPMLLGVLGRRPPSLRDKGDVGLWRFQAGLGLPGVQPKLASCPDFPPCSKWTPHTQPILEPDNSFVTMSSCS